MLLKGADDTLTLNVHGNMNCDLYKSLSFGDFFQTSNISFRQSLASVSIFHLLTRPNEDQWVVYRP